MKTHKIRLSETEIQKLLLSLRFYFHEADRQDNFRMLIDKEVLSRLAKVLTKRLFDLQFVRKKEANVVFQQIEIDLIWTAMGQMQDLRDVLLKIGSKTHSYAA